MEQRCHLSMVWLTWLGLPLLAVVVGYRAGVVAGVVVLAVGVVGQVLYVRWFPSISRSMGYGSVADTPAAAVPARGPLPDVTLYTANVCPFCPIIRRRLADLQRQSRFEVREIDVTFRPEIVRAKGLLQRSQKFDGDIPLSRTAEDNRSRRAREGPGTEVIVLRLETRRHIAFEGI